MMLKNARLLGCRGRRFQSSKPIISFIPNEDIYQFEGERLTPEQNKAAIPKKPEVDDIPKIHIEMLSPEYVADLVVNPVEKDTVVTSLALNSPFSGESSYTVIPQDPKLSPSPVHLLFSDITRKYNQVYNEQIAVVKSLPQRQPLPTLSNSVANSIHDIIQTYKAKKNVENIFTVEILTDICESSKAFENTRMVSSGDVDVSSAVSLATLENFCIYNLLTLDVKNESDFEIMMTFVNENMSLFTVQGLRRLVETLIDILAKNSTKKIIDVSCTLMLDEMFKNYSNMLYHLDPTHLDRLVSILALHGNVAYSGDILKALIKTRKFASSSASTAEFLKAYIAGHKNVDPVQFIRDTHILKPVFFSRTISPEEAEIILTYGVRNTFELEHFIRLLSNNSSQSLLELGNQIIAKMANLQESTTENSLKSLELVQVLQNLKSKGFVPDQQTKTILLEAFTNLGDDINRELVDKL